jgi:hypothetical protein
MVTSGWPGKGLVKCRTQGEKRSCVGERIGRRGDQGERPSCRLIAGISEQQRLADARLALDEHYASESPLCLSQQFADHGPLGVTAVQRDPAARQPSVSDAGALPGHLGKSGSARQDNGDQWLAR